MQLPQPYFYTSPRMIGMVDRPQMVPHEGPLADPVYGYHTLWIAEVPFIPAPVGESHGDFDQAASNRVKYAMQRQVRFLYDLAKSREALSTFELRFVSWPRPGGFSQVGIAFLGKTFHEDEAISRRLAAGLWNQFSALFPREAPFSYPLVPVTEGDSSLTGQTHTFAEWYQPISIDNITRPGSLVELRKYEDWPTIRDVGGTLHARDYISHPFVAALDYSAMARLFETLARQQRICIVSITLRPQRLTDQEIAILHELAGWYQRVAKGEEILDNPLVEVLREFKSNVFEASLSARAELGQSVYQNLVREHRSLFTVRLQVIGDPVVENDLIEALGSEVMANAGSSYPSRWTRVEPQDEREFYWSRFNLQWLEFARWGISSRVRQAPAIIRLRQLVTVSEAAGAFRLPIAPSGGGLAGIAVRDEPFSVSSTAFNVQSDLSFTIGNLHDRGVPTDLPLTLTIDSLSGFTYLFGSSGKSQDEALRGILRGATKYGLPWVLIKQQGRDKTHITEGLPVSYTAVDTLKSQQVCSIQPFLPPAGIPLAAFLDALLRVFTAAFHLDAATTPVLRHALMEVYSSASNSETFNLATLVAKLDRAIQQESAPAALTDALHTQCILPLQDLAMTLGASYSLSGTTDGPLTTPLVVELGWIGSDTSSAIVQGCIWIWCALALSMQAASPDHDLQGLVAIENVRTLFGAGAQEQNSSASLSSLAQMFVRAGVGTLLIDDRPDLLDKGMIHQPGMTIFTYNAHETAVDDIVARLDMSKREKARIRRLTRNEAVIARSGAEPVLVTM